MGPTRSGRGVFREVLPSLSLQASRCLAGGFPIEKQAFCFHAAKPPLEEGMYRNASYPHPSDATSALFWRVLRPGAFQGVSCRGLSLQAQEGRSAAVSLAQPPPPKAEEAVGKVALSRCIDAGGFPGGRRGSWQDRGQDAGLAARG